MHLFMSICSSKAASYKTHNLFSESSKMPIACELVEMFGESRDILYISDIFPRHHHEVMFYYRTMVEEDLS